MSTKYGMHMGIKQPQLDCDSNKATLISLAAGLLPVMNTPGKWNDAWGNGNLPGNCYLMTELVYMPQRVVSGTTYPAHVCPTDRSGNVSATDVWNGGGSGGYDQLILDLSAAGLKWCPSIHPVSRDVTGLSLPLPCPDSGYASIFEPIYTSIDSGNVPRGINDINDYGSIVQRIMARYGPGGSFIVANPGTLPIDTVALWVEPNTKTGNMGGLMTPYIYVHLVSQGAAYAKQGGAQNVFAPEMGTVDMPFLQSLFTEKPDWVDGVSHITFHMHPGYQDPTLAPSSKQPRRPRDCEYIKPLLQQYGYYTKGVVTTEAAYSGTTDTVHPPNMTTEALQNTYETEMIQYFRDTINSDFYFHYRIIDDYAHTSSGTPPVKTFPLTPNYDDHLVSNVAPYGDISPYDPDYVDEHDGLTSSAGTYKAAGTSFKQIVQGAI